MSLINFLLVDDEKPFVDVIAQRLCQRGFSVDCAFTGIQALDILEKKDTIDVVVLDIKMPDLDGIKTLEKIKKKYPLIEVIMLTGHSAINSAVETLKFGAFDYLTKPCDLNDIISKAEQAVIRKKEREAKIFDVRIKLYITEQERSEMIAKILDS
jgi:DNA-binding NtrC family response regulator